MVWKREPVLVMGAIQAIIGLLVAFGLELTVEQVGAILVFGAAVLSIATRRYVAPTVTPRPHPDPEPA